jgi:CHAD domain-containing protein
MTVAVKGSARTRVNPLKALKEQVVALDAAMLVAVTATEVGAVHKLRTTTRRVEAQLRLMELVSGGDKPLPLPPHADEADAVRRRLGKVRRAAGAVRDLDVQTGIIALDAPQKNTVHKGSPGDIARREAKALRKHLESEREHEAARLVLVLKAEEQKLAASLRALEQALKPAGRGSVAQSTLAERIDHWFSRETKALLRRPASKQETAEESLRLAVEGLGEDGLHTLRKAAKQCRYMAESAPEGSPAQAMAERFEAMQEAGGHWHDWLLLEQLSRRFHGKKAELTLRYAKHRDAALADYHLKLAELLPSVAETKKV